MARHVAVSVLLVSLAFAGCIGGGDDGADDTASAAETDFNKTNPQGATLVAFEETNQTEGGVDGVDHHHDYWQGRSRVVLFEEHTQMAPFPDDQNRALGSFRPPQGTLVYEGTATIEFTITNPERRICEPFFTFDGDFICHDNAATFAGGPEAPRIPDANPTAGMQLRYKHASTTQWIDVGTLTWGAPLAIKITDALHTDMPHATSSLWEFQVVSPNAYDSTLTFTAKAELVRGEGDIPLWPGHPDFYPDRTSRVVLDTTAEACAGAGCTLASDEAGPVLAERLVSYGTRSLHVWVNISETTFPNPVTAPNHWFLFHLNATGRTNLTNPFDPEATTDIKEFYWIFPVDDNGMDSPYADGSRWSFQLGGSLTTPVISCFTGCTDWHAKYAIVAHATNVQLAPEEYTYYCLRDEECPAAA